MGAESWPGSVWHEEVTWGGSCFLQQERMMGDGKLFHVAWVEDFPSQCDRVLNMRRCSAWIHPGVVCLQLELVSRDAVQIHEADRLVISINQCKVSSVWVTTRYRTNQTLDQLDRSDCIQFKPTWTVRTIILCVQLSTALSQTHTEILLRSGVRTSRCYWPETSWTRHTESISKSGRKQDLCWCRRLHRLVVQTYDIWLWSESVRRPQDFSEVKILPPVGGSRDSCCVMSVLSRFHTNSWLSITVCFMQMCLETRVIQVTIMT